MKAKLTHTDASGKAKMVDVSLKPDQMRTAKASGNIKVSAETIALIRENKMKKGDVLHIAEIAGIQAAKKNAELIPLCHPLQLTSVDVNASLGAESVQVESVVKCVGPTGVEMEALTAVSVALLTVYDMCKAVDKNMCIENIRLLSKEKETLPS